MSEEEWLDEKLMNELITFDPMYKTIELGFWIRKYVPEKYLDGVVDILHRMFKNWSSRDFDSEGKSLRIFIAELRYHCLSLAVYG